ncbi:MAG: chemotaxis protein CheX [Treponema sp.]|jgi:chemotaxis protein CheX|nr:chemotaxis protein CheX [Treponema sp.]
MEQYIQPFIKVCRNVFKELVEVNLTVDRPYFSDQKAVHQWDISAIIGLSGDARGAVVISMRKGLSLRITDLLTGSSHGDIDDDVVDAVGEIVNIIAGNVKKELEEEFRLIISLPTIVQGEWHHVKWPSSQARIICIPFNMGRDMFNLSVAIEAFKGKGD